MTEAAQQAPKKSGRKAETPAERLARLEQDIAAARLQVKEARKSNLAIMAAALVEEAMSRPEFMEMIREILQRRVVPKASLAAVSELLSA